MIILILLLSLPVAFFLYRGMYYTYCAYRFSRKTTGDKTAAFWHFDNLTWILASQAKQLAERIPALKQDLSEVYGFDDDGEIT